jgi:hypothetical protein
MTIRSKTTFPAAMLMATALSWGFNAQAAGLGVGVGLGVDANVGANTGIADVRLGTHSGISSDVRARAIKGVNGRSDARYQNEGRSGAALSAVTDAKAQGAATVGSQVKSAVSVDGQVRSQARGTTN